MTTLRACLALILFMLPLPNTAAADRITITIDEPKEGTKVLHRHEIIGRVSPPNANVWVVIRPMEIAGFWVQPPVTVRENGMWKVIGYFGDSAPVHVGKRFEVRAFANPVGTLSEGKTKQWPEAAAKSNVVEVIRR